VPIVSRIPPKVLAELQVYWRRRWVVLAVGWGLSLVGWLVVMTIPDRYEAMTRIYVETENLLTPLLRNITVQADVTKQIEVLQRTLLNRKNMESVAHSADLDLGSRTDQDKENLYAGLAKQISVKAEGSNLFSVAYSNSNPQMAKKVVESLLTIFVETNLGENRSSMENARNFIDTEIANYERQLKQADENLADFMSRHVETAPGQGNANFASRLDSARQALATARANVEDMTASRTQLAANLATVPQFLEIDSPAQVIISGGGQTATTGRGRVRQLEAELSRLQAQDTDQHPDVVAVKRDLELARQLAEKEASQPDGASAESGHGRIPNPLYEQVKLRLFQAEADLAQAHSRAKIADEEVHRLQSVAETAPKIEAELADLNREYSVIKGKYEELLGRRESARLSEAAENKGDKVQFRIIEPPRVPTRPSFPNRPLLLSGTLVLSLALGAGVVFIMHKLDDAVGSVATLTEEFNVKVYGSIPRVESVVGKTRRHLQLRHFEFGAGGLLATFLMVLTLASLQQSFPELLHMDLPTFFQKMQNHVG
jgi:polysaccharide chain length determinant protein (PEP-CTERM system associated)